MPKTVVDVETDESEPSDDGGIWVPQGWDEDAIEQVAAAIPSPISGTALRRQLAVAERQNQTKETSRLEAEICNDDLSLYEAYMLEGRRRQIVRYESHLPFYICSVGCHIINIFSITSCGTGQHRDSSPGSMPITFENESCIRKKRPSTYVATEGGGTRDLRLHIMMVGAPGSGKAIFPQVLVGRDALSLIPPSRFPSKFFGNLTAAGMFGSIEADPKNPKRSIYRYGEAFDYCSGFLCCEEFNFVKAAAGTQHSQGIEDRFLSFLERGVVENTMKSGTYTYVTATTNWLGNQSDRMWFGTGESGMSRRMGVDLNVIDADANAELIAAYRRRLEIHPSQKILDVLGRRFERMVDAFDVRKIVYDSAYHEFLDSETYHMGLGSQFFGLHHTEQAIMDKIAIGYSLMNRPQSQWPDQTLTIRVDDALKSIIHRQLAVREFLFAHTSLIDAEIQLRLVWHEQKAEQIQKDAFVREMIRLGGYSSDHVSKALNGLISSGKIACEGGTSDPVLRATAPNAWAKKRLG